MRLIDADALIPNISIKAVFGNDITTMKCGELRTVLEMIENAPTIEPQRWIPVSETLPEEDIEVLTYDSSFGITFDSLHRGKWRKHPVAWMPLPPSYKGGTGCD